MHLSRLRNLVLPTDPCRVPLIPCIHMLIRVLPRMRARLRGETSAAFADLRVSPDSKQTDTYIQSCSYSEAACDPVTLRKRWQIRLGEPCQQGMAPGMKLAHRTTALPHHIHIANHIKRILNKYDAA